MVTVRERGSTMESRTRYGTAVAGDDSHASLLASTCGPPGRGARQRRSRERRQRCSKPSEAHRDHVTRTLAFGKVLEVLGERGRDTKVPPRSHDTLAGDVAMFAAQIGVAEEESGIVAQPIYQLRSELNRGMIQQHRVEHPGTGVAQREIPAVQAVQQEGPGPERLEASP